MPTKGAHNIKPKPNQTTNLTSPRVRRTATHLLIANKPASARGHKCASIQAKAVWARQAVRNEQGSRCIYSPWHRLAQQSRSTRCVHAMLSKRRQPHFTLPNLFLFRKYPLPTCVWHVGPGEWKVVPCAPQILACTPPGSPAEPLEATAQPPPS